MFDSCRGGIRSGKPAKNRHPAWPSGLVGVAAGGTRDARGLSVVARALRSPLDDAGLFFLVWRGEGSCAVRAGAAVRAKDGMTGGWGLQRCCCCCSCSCAPLLLEAREHGQTSSHAACSRFRTLKPAQAGHEIPLLDQTGKGMLTTGCHVVAQTMLEKAKPTAQQGN